MPDHKPNVVSQKGLEGCDEILTQALLNTRVLQYGIQSLKCHPRAARSDGGLSKGSREIPYRTFQLRNEDVNGRHVTASQVSVESVTQHF